MSRRPFYSKQDLDSLVAQDRLVLILGEDVYDFTDFKHPGGKQILVSYKGQDATMGFLARHPDSWTERMQRFRLGKYNPSYKEQIPDMSDKTAAEGNVPDAISKFFVNESEDVLSSVKSDAARTLRVEGTGVDFTVKKPQQPLTMESCIPGAIQGCSYLNSDFFNPIQLTFDTLLYQLGM